MGPGSQGDPGGGRSAGSVEPQTVDDVVARAVHHVGEVVLVLDAAGTVLWANEAVTRVLGWAPPQWVGSSATELVHPDDVPLGLEVLAAAMATGEGMREPVTYRLAHADGSFVEMVVMATAVNLTDGTPLLMVSARDEGRARPQRAIVDDVAQRVWTMFDESLLGMAQVSLDGHILRANRRIARLVGAQDGTELVGRPLAELVHDDEGDVLHGPDGLLVGAGGERAQVQLCPVESAPDHPATYTRLAAALVPDARGGPLYYAVQAVDISDLVHAQTELRAVEAELRHHLRHDALTGLPNRTELADWLERVARPDDAVLFLDLDGFKRVNDTTGHAAGDALLTEVAARLRTHLRHSDVVARIGGDEFVVLCPRTDEATALALAERLVRAIVEPVATGRGDVAVGVSVGVATGDGTSTFESVIARADLALYEAKDVPGPHVVAHHPAAPGSPSSS